MRRERRRQRWRVELRQWLGLRRQYGLRLLGRRLRLVRRRLQLFEQQLQLRQFVELRQLLELQLRQQQLLTAGGTATGRGWRTRPAGTATGGGIRGNGSIGADTRR
ncbi:hypothetical protein [Streptomyces sp. NPDC059552]|uniref:hypothetical protein n=1 Tax=Streptomyces sp. NPDC059552 TaxID=3346862 RepID=UPI0036C17BA8